MDGWMDGWRSNTEMTKNEKKSKNSMDKLLTA